MVSRQNPVFQWFDPIVSLSPKIVLLFQEGGFGMDKFVLFHKVDFFFNATVQKSVYQFVQLLFCLANLVLNILGESLRRLALLFVPYFHLCQHFVFPVVAKSDFLKPTL
ncbi:MAG: hypothetical protein A3A83_01755 [Candidatus Doudnabacteria bacterium RIFCSPLOWO2_01_FULL_48_57]|nr:MAG: hypothetical protein A2668_00210 [Candidatus Doudnabacteria bacterium RIFCSPHIGHO2_01_FULL_48_180]OGE96671.1 MAG: hypothetical protein A3A83_01755 [Candidatus Doudnabacteria bacterium RIFCSPLOWO2_01_FULL_48_57]